MKRELPFDRVSDRTAEPRNGPPDHVVLSDMQFDRARRLASCIAGIELVDRHRDLLSRRSRRFGIRDGSRFDLLLAAAEAGETDAVSQVLGLVTTKFTGFFRHPGHFDLAATHALRAIRERGHARLWSAAVATGEEPYSLAIAIAEAWNGMSPPVEILATEVDPSALRAAEKGEFNELALQAVEDTRRRRFFKRTPGARSWTVLPGIRDLVTFRALNLIDPRWALDGPFDVIFCRNVLMYLEPGHRHRVRERMAVLLAPGGMLMLDPAENCGKSPHLLPGCASGVYLRRPVPIHAQPTGKNGANL